MMEVRLPKLEKGEYYSSARIPVRLPDRTVVGEARALNAKPGYFEIRVYDGNEALLEAIGLGTLQDVSISYGLVPDINDPQQNGENHD